MSEPSEEARRSRRQSGEPALHGDHFPPLKKFNPPDKLPTKASVVGRVRYLCSGGKNNMSNDKAAVEVAKEVYSKYFHDTVFCLSKSKITQCVKDLWKVQRDGGRVARAGRMNLKLAQDYQKLIKSKDDLFDMATEDPEQKKKLEVEWGVKMGVKEKLYLDDQRGPRLMACDSGVDPVFYRAFMKQQRLKEKNLEYQEKRDEEFRGKNIEQIEQYLRDQGEIVSTSPESVATPLKGKETNRRASETPIMTLEEDLGGELGSKRRRLFDSSGKCTDVPVEKGQDDPVDQVADPLPSEFRHLRSSEKKVKDAFYLTCSDLSAEGLSLKECIDAVCIVGRGMFGRSWRKSEESNWANIRSRLDTAPERIRVLQYLRNIEAERLSLIAEKMKESKEQGHMVTHASDSTTKKRVGQFIGQVVNHVYFFQC